MASRRKGRRQTANERLRDLTIRHALLLERLKRHEVDKIGDAFRARLLREVRGRLESRLRRIKSRGFDSGPWTTQLHRQVVDAVKSTVNRGFGVLTDGLSSSMADFAATEAEWQVVSVQRSAPIEIELAIPTATRLRAAYMDSPAEGRFLRDWLADDAAVTRSRFLNVINRGLARGDSMRTMSSALRRDVDIATHHARTMVRTAIAHVSSSTRRTVVQENSSVLQDRWMFLATLDLRTSDQCYGLDGTTWPHDEGPYPPIHPNCRSIPQILLRSIEEILGVREAGKADPNVRASMRGEVPSTVRGRDWIMDQSVEDQDIALGKTRARLLRSGQITFDSLFDEQFRPLNLAEIARREGLPASAVAR